MTLPNPFFVGRDKVVERVIDRLTHPDDVRQSPKEFIQPGFYGLGGVGKSRLLVEIASAAARVTPYVARFDFASAAETPAPGSPLFFIAELIDQLDAMDQQQRSRWKPWDRGNRFEECGRLLAAVGVPSAVVSVTATHGGAISGSPVTVNQSAQDEERFLLQLTNAFHTALANLRYASPVEQRWGKLAEPRPRPLVVVVIDSLDSAPAPMRAWLPQHLYALLGNPSPRVHALALVAGREQSAALTPTLLEPLTGRAAEEFIHFYAFQSGASMDAAAPLRGDTPLRRTVIELAAGVPLLLQIFTDLALAAPDKLSSGQGQWPARHEERVRYVIALYLEQLAQQERWNRYNLLAYGAVPRRLVSDRLLAALLEDLPGTPYSAATNYLELFQRLHHEGYVQGAPISEAVVFHSLVREGALAHLAERDRNLCAELHRRAAAWFAAQGNEVERLYHAAQADYARVIGELRRQIEAALAQGDWPLVQRWIDATGELPLTTEDGHWLALYKADLAWGEGNSSLALRRIADLIVALDPTFPVRLATGSAVSGAGEARVLVEAVLQRLERWLGFKVDAGDDDSFKPTELWLWWAERRNQPKQAGRARLALGDVALMQDRLADAQQHYEQARTLSQQSADRLGEAHAALGLGDVARRQDRLADAQQHYEQARTLSQQSAYRLGEAHAARGLGDVALRQDRGANALDHWRRSFGLFPYQQWGFNDLLISANQGLDHAQVLLDAGDAARACRAVETGRSLYAFLAQQRARLGSDDVLRHIDTRLFALARRLDEAEQECRRRS